MRISTRRLTYTVLLVSMLVPGCTSADDDVVAGGSESEVVASSRDRSREDDDALVKELRAATAGLETNGGDGPPEPFHVALLGAVPDPLSERAILEHVLPALEGVVRTDDETPGADERPLAEVWPRYIARPDPTDFEDDPEGLAEAEERARRWAHVKDVLEAKLGTLRYFDIGYRSSFGTLETGAVANTILGVTPSGRLIAIWGIVVWT